MKIKKRRIIMNLGEELKFHRKNNKLTLQKLEQLTNISNQNLSRWERNESIPSINFCIILADFYQISLDELVGRDFQNNNLTK